MTSRRDVDRALRQIAAHFGVDVRRVTNARRINYSYDGATIRIRHPSKALDDFWFAELSHEIGHLVMSPADLRREAEYGLGTSPVLSILDGIRLVPGPEANQIESRASMAGILILRCLGLRRAASEIYVEHNWSGSVCHPPDTSLLWRALDTARMVKKNVEAAVRIGCS